MRPTAVPAAFGVWKKKRPNVFNFKNFDVIGSASGLKFGQVRATVDHVLAMRDQFFVTADLARPPWPCGVSMSSTHA
jgi:hypothetical protein